MLLADVVRFWQVRIRHTSQLQHHVLVAIQALTMRVLAFKTHFRVNAIREHDSCASIGAVIICVRHVVRTLDSPAAPGAH